MDFRQRFKQALLTPEMQEQLEQIPAASGGFSRDPWGMDVQSTWLSFAVCKRLYDHYFRVQTHGLNNVPAEGRVLIVANHSGQLPMDGILLATALATSAHGPRAPRAMVDRFVSKVPFVGHVFNQAGAVTGDPVNCRLMLEHESCIIVFPEGVRGSGKPFKDRYQLQRFGHGFMHLAINHNTPIIPVGIVGCEETMPSAGNVKPLAKLLNVPYVPIALPFLLPARVTLNFGEPMMFSGHVRSERQVKRHVGEVKQSIRRLIDDGLAKRRSIY